MAEEGWVFIPVIRPFHLCWESQNDDKIVQCNFDFIPNYILFLFTGIMIIIISTSASKHFIEAFYFLTLMEGWMNEGM